MIRVACIALIVFGGDIHGSGHRADAASPTTTIEQSTRLIGVHARGVQTELDRLQHLASAHGFPCRQLAGPTGWELIIAFPTTSDPKIIADFIEQLATFPSLRFEVASVRR